MEENRQRNKLLLFSKIKGENHTLIIPVAKLQDIRRIAKIL